MREDSYLEYPLIINLIEDSPVDLIGFQGYPVKDRHTELCLDGFLDLNSWTWQRGVNIVSMSSVKVHTQLHSHMRRETGERVDRYLQYGDTHTDVIHLSDL